MLPQHSEISGEDRWAHPVSDVGVEEGAWRVSIPERPLGLRKHTHILKECLGGRKLVLGQVLSWILMASFPRQ